MNIEMIQQWVRKERYNLSGKVERRILDATITEEQIEETVLKGNVQKKEPDEVTDGKYRKITIHWRSWYVVVKTPVLPL